MDNYLDKNRFRSLFKTYALSESQILRRTARAAALLHLKTFDARNKFIREVDVFIGHQIEGIRKGKNERECQQCLFNLREEKRYIDDQTFSLMSGRAKVVASAELVNKLDTWGYIINGVSIVLGGVQVISGFSIAFASFAHGNIVGVIAGATLFLHGFNAIQEGSRNIVNNKNNDTGSLKEGYIATAEFLGFDEKTGRLAYNLMDLSLSGYGLFRMSLKPNAWRLFSYMPSDYVRNFERMSPPTLFIEGVGDALSIKSGYDSKNSS